ncbi:MAG: cyanophycinase [Dichotomicrobium sp.]
MDTVSTPPAPGPLIAIGGAEDRTSEAIILARVMSLAPEDNKTVGVITTASSIPAEVFAGYEAVFTRLGAGKVHDLRIRTRAEADNAEHVRTIGTCGVIFISGGDQMRLTNILGASRSLEAIRKRHDAGAVVAGTSAGAACMSTTMVYGGPAGDSLRKGAVKMSGGLAFAEGVIIDTHFLERGRFSRLMEVGATNPEYVGVGLGEDAAIQFLDGHALEAFGPGHVVIVDSAQITGSNVYDVNYGEAVTVHNVVMHALINGYGYDIMNRRVLMPDDLRAWKSERNIAYS